MRASLSGVGLPEHASASEPLPPLPSVAPITCIATSCGVASSSFVPEPTPSDSNPASAPEHMDKSFSGYGGDQPAQAAPCDRTRWPRNCREGYGREAPPFRRDVQDTQPRDKSWKGANPDATSTSFAWWTW